MNIDGLTRIYWVPCEYDKAKKSVVEWGIGSQEVEYSTCRKVSMHISIILGVPNYQFPILESLSRILYIYFYHTNVIN